ncbi:MAG: hypothetical protein GWP91_02705 [Rhodobacterales bacterium]|nr:hypothetical protein [Rhodobacterales bacterium]
MLSESRTKVYPPGPYPPHGVERDGEVDLGIRMRDQLLRSEVISGGVRQVLADRLNNIARAGRLSMAPSLVDALLDTWPLAAVVDDARDRWVAGPDGEALLILSRAMHVVGMALGWPETIDRRWPMPDVDWIEREAGEGPFDVVIRGRADGAPATATVLNTFVALKEPLDTPPVRSVQGDEIVDMLDELLSSVASGEYAAIRFESPVPWDELSQAALATLEESNPKQRLFRRFGLAGLLVDDTPEHFDDLLGTPKIHKATLRPQTRCSGLVLPRLSENGQVTTVGAVAWEAAIKPVLVHPLAIQLLQLLDGEHTRADLLDADDRFTPEILDHLLTQLQEIGAI